MYHQFLKDKLKEVCHNPLDEKILRNGLKVLKGN